MPTETTTPDRTDRDRLVWMHARDASFGTSSRFVGVEGGRVIWRDATFVRVPCRVLYEWHCYDGEDFRAAIDAAIDGPPCCVTDEGRCANGRFAPMESDHPYAQALAELADRLATAEARVRELEADAERLTKLQRLIAPNPEQGHGADVMLYGGPRDVAIGYGAWHTTMGDLRPSQYATATDLRAAIDLIPDESAARASHQGGAET